MVFLWLAGRRRPPVLRTQERHRRVVGQEGQPAKHDPPHREAGRAGGAGEHLVLTRKDFMGNHEWCFYGWREGAAHQFYGPKNATDVWSVKKVNPQSMIHLTEKPVELAARASIWCSPARTSWVTTNGVFMVGGKAPPTSFTDPRTPPTCGRSRRSTRKA